MTCAAIFKICRDTCARQRVVDYLAIAHAVEKMVRWSTKLSVMLVDQMQGCDASLIAIPDRTSDDIRHLRLKIGLSTEYACC